MFKERKKYFEMRRSLKRFVIFLGVNLSISFLDTGMFPASCFRQRTYTAQGLVNEVLNET